MQTPGQTQLFTLQVIEYLNELMNEWTNAIPCDEI